MRKKKGQQKVYIYIYVYLLVNRSFSNLDNYSTADWIKRRYTKLLCKCAYYVGVPWYGRYAFHITVSKCQAAALRYSTSQMRPILSNPTDASNDLLPGRSVYDENARLHSRKQVFEIGARSVDLPTIDQTDR